MSYGVWASVVNFGAFLLGTLNILCIIDVIVRLDIVPPCKGSLLNLGGPSKETKPGMLPAESPAEGGLAAAAVYRRFCGPKTL